MCLMVNSPNPSQPGNQKSGKHVCNTLSEKSRIPIAPDFICNQIGLLLLLLAPQ